MQMEISHWHPMLVHLPLGLWCTVPFLYTCAAISKSPRRSGACASAGTVNLLLGSCAALAAIATGLLAVSGLSLVGIAQHTLTRHIAWASITTLAFIALTLLRTVGRPFDARPGAAFIASLWFLLLALGVTGFYGGLNVYRYGLAVDLGTATERALHRPPNNAEPPPPLP